MGFRKVTFDYSRAEVSRAGSTLLSSNSTSPEFSQALEVLNNWRACHTYPMNTFQATLRARLKRSQTSAVVAQRLKRVPAILAKLRRFGTMKLAQMQDIGGLRVILSDVPTVRKIDSGFGQSRFDHELVNRKDYIIKPKTSGYRGIHLVYRYRGSQTSEFDGLMLELQIRTRLQHAWATAVETMSTFLTQALKASEGDQQWLDFFALVGSAFAHVERQPPVPGFDHLTRQQTFEQAIRRSRKMGVAEKLTAFRAAADHLKKTQAAHKGAQYYLLRLEAKNQKIHITPFDRRNLDTATQRYLAAEKQIDAASGDQVVLVAADSVTQLQKAYPNYFLDTKVFIEQLARLEGLK